MNKRTILLLILFSSSLSFAQNVENTDILQKANKIGDCWTSNSYDCFNFIEIDKTIEVKRKKNYQDSKKEFRKKKLKPEKLNLEKVLVFEDFGFDVTYDILNYQVYYFFQSKNKNRSYIAEGDLYLKQENEIVSLDIDAIHPAKTLTEYIKTRAENDMIESHPPNVENYLKNEK